MLLVDESSRGERGRLALLDYGLMAELGSKEREGMVRKRKYFTEYFLLLPCLSVGVSCGGRQERNECTRCIVYQQS